MKFTLYATVTVSAYTIVEADSEEEAIAKVIDEGMSPVIGGMNSGEDPEESWIVDDADGEPENIHGDR